jgi:hypothetical protein
MLAFQMDIRSLTDPSETKVSFLVDGFFTAVEGSDDEAAAAARAALALPGFHLCVTFLVFSGMMLVIEVVGLNVFPLLPKQ